MLLEKVIIQPLDFCGQNSDFPWAKEQHSVLSGFISGPASSALTQTASPRQVVCQHYFMSQETEAPKFLFYFLCLLCLFFFYTQGKFVPLLML